MNSKSTEVATVALSAQSSLCNGKYRIIRKLGSGGFGITYLAVDNSLQREVAIKECFPRDLVIRNNAGTNEILPLEGHEAEFEKYREAFRREAQILAKLPKTNGLVSVFLLEEDNNTWYIIMEYLPGQPLDCYLAENGPVDPVWLLKMIKPLLEALDLVHRNGLVHRDISPDNLMLSPDKDHLTLMDFGSAVLLEDGRLTHAIGKPGFSPIEQYDVTNELTAASDIYALSATIYYLLSGHQPTQATSRVLSKFAGGADPIVRLRSMNDSISQDVEDLVFRGMQLDARDRYQTAHEMAEAIDRILDDTPLPPEPEQIIYRIKYYYDNICDEGLTRIKTALRGSLITDYEMEPKSGYEFERCEPQPFYNGKNLIDNVLRIYYVRSNKTEILKCPYRIEYYFDDVCDEQLTKVGIAEIGSYLPITPEKEIDGYYLEGTKPSTIKIGPSPEENAICIYYRSRPQKKYQYRIEYYYDNKRDDSLTTIKDAYLSESIDTFDQQDKAGYILQGVKPSKLIILEDETKNILRVYYGKRKITKSTHWIKPSLLCAVCLVFLYFIFEPIEWRPVVDGNGIYCFFNGEGELITPKQWRYVGDFSEGLAPVQMLEGSYCYIDTMGQIVFPYQWEYAGSFSNGLALVKENGLYGFIDTTGKQVIPCQWKDAGSFSDGIARVQIDYRYGFINTKGEPITPCHWDEAYSFNNGLARVEKDGLWGVINTEGELAIPCQWEYIKPFSEGLACVEKDGLWGVINTDGELVIPCRWEYAESFSEGFACVMENDLYGFIDTTGKQVIPCKWKEARSFSEGLALVKNEALRHGYINTEGELVIPCQWELADSFSDGLAAVCMIDQGWGYINAKGEQVIACQWNYANSFHEGIAAVCLSEDGSAWYYINTKGQTVVPGGWFYAGDHNDGIVQVEENVGFIYTVRYTIQVNSQYIDPVQ